MVSLIRAASESRVWFRGPTTARPGHVFMVCAVGRSMRKIMIQTPAICKEQGSYYDSDMDEYSTQLRQRDEEGFHNNPFPRGNSLNREPSKRT